MFKKRTKHFKSYIMDWSRLLHPVRKDMIPFLDVAESLSLNSAMTDHEMRLHLVESYNDLQFPAFDRLKEAST